MSAPTDADLKRAQELFGHTARCSMGMEMAGVACRCGAGLPELIAQALTNARASEREDILGAVRDELNDLGFDPIKRRTFENVLDNALEVLDSKRQASMSGKT